MSILSTSNPKSIGVIFGGILAGLVAIKIGFRDCKLYLDEQSMSTKSVKHWVYFAKNEGLSADKIKRGSLVLVIPNENQRNGSIARFFESRPKFVKYARGLPGDFFATDAHNFYIAPKLAEDARVDRDCVQKVRSEQESVDFLSLKNINALSACLAGYGPIEKVAILTLEKLQNKETLFGVVSPGKLLMFGEGEHSFDSRYFAAFGPVDESNIFGYAKVIL